MISVAQSLDRLEEAVGSGELARLCGDHRVEIVVLFGSAASGENPGDIDLAVGFAHPGERDFLAVVNALGTLVPGDHLDVMDLDRADPVAQRAALDDGQVLFEAADDTAAERRIHAFIAYEDTRWLRRLQQKALLS